ncbi:MAG: alanine racemase [Paenirhodobacter sp.]|uniref:alanine racemase n=1 Tax=Paenirhodobacter sp. TaxID=1965326 RepID=UPI003D0B1978
MATASLHIDLDAILANWRAMDALTGPGTETGAVVKADSYGLGAARVARLLARAGCRKFFTACAEEGAAVRAALGEGPEIFCFAGHAEGDTALIGEARLTPMLNSIDQVTRHFEALPGAPFGVQLDTGMNRLGMEEAEWEGVAPIVLGAGVQLIMSHLACSDEPAHEMNARQLEQFHYMTDGLDVPRSLSATGGILLGPAYHFDVTRPGIALYGGLPFAQATPVVRLSLPVLQVRDVAPGESVGYSNTFIARRETRIATLAAGYADGLARTLSSRATLWAGDIPCPLVGRISMDLITADITDLPDVPAALDILGPHQGVDALADVAGTIGYEVLTSLGARYRRVYHGGAA